MSRPSASFATTLVVGVASAGLAAVASNAVWAVGDATAPGRPDELSGGDLVPVVVPLALVTLACWGAVLVLRRRGRRVVAVVGVGAALAASVLTLVQVAGANDLDPTVWPWVVAGSAAVTAFALARAWIAAPGWPEMSGRYDRRAEHPVPAQQRPPTPVELWQALDEGRDPTA